MVNWGDHMTRKPDAKKNKAKKGTQQHVRYRENNMQSMEINKREATVDHRCGTGVTKTGTRQV